MTNFCWRSGRPVPYDRRKGTTVALRCLLVATIAAGACAGRPPQAAAPAAPAPDAFRTEVAPILARRCEPCHNPGGRMYAAMPFDQPATVTAHPEGILKRIKDPAEHAAIASWLSRNTPR